MKLATIALLVAVGLAVALFFSSQLGYDTGYVGMFLNALGSRPTPRPGTQPATTNPGATAQQPGVPTSSVPVGTFHGPTGQPTVHGPSGPPPQE